LEWLGQNPTKRPQYIVLLLGIPSKTDFVIPGYYYNSISYRLSEDIGQFRGPRKPFVTHINMGSLTDCQAYIAKLANFGNTYSPGELVIRPSAAGYQNNQYYFDDKRTVSSRNVGLEAKTAVLQQNPSATVHYVPDDDALTHLALYNQQPGVNVAGYYCWGNHSELGWHYAVGHADAENQTPDGPGYIQFDGDSAWFIIASGESWNGLRDTGQGGKYMGNYTDWFSSGAFRGNNYSRTPVGGVGHVNEPMDWGIQSGEYFALWEAGKNFAISAWNSRNTAYLIAVGDPLVCR
jgi:hypothetical protein